MKRQRRAGAGSRAVRRGRWRPGPARTRPRNSSGSPTVCFLSSIRDRLSARCKARGRTFSNVLDVVRKRVPASGPVSAADGPQQGRHGSASRNRLTAGSVPVRAACLPAEALAPLEFLRESADVYAYLGRERWARDDRTPTRCATRPPCTSPRPTGGADTGEGGVYPRGVTPRRVLRPLVAMLAMTGVLTGPEGRESGGVRWTRDGTSSTRSNTAGTTGGICPPQRAPCRRRRSADGTPGSGTGCAIPTSRG